jgi:hypothetical protein
VIVDDAQRTRPDCLKDQREASDQRRPFDQQFTTFATASRQRARLSSSGLQLAAWPRRCVAHPNPHAISPGEAAASALGAHYFPRRPIGFPSASASTQTRASGAT